LYKIIDITKNKKSEKFLEGVTLCMAHPLYHPQGVEIKNIFMISKHSSPPSMG